MPVSPMVALRAASALAVALLAFVGLLAAFGAPTAGAAGLTNAGFEAGLDGWTATRVPVTGGGYGFGEPGQEGTAEPATCRVPDGVCVLSASDTIQTSEGYGGATSYTVAPAEGTRMVRLGGPFTASGESQKIERYRLEQAFTVQPGQTSIPLAFNAFTWDYTGFDVLRFRVTLTDDSGEVLTERVLGSFGQGVSLKTTGWRSAGIDLSGYEGREVRLRIEAGGTSDTAYGFWAYVDLGDSLPASPVGSPEAGTPPATPSGQPVLVNEQTDPATGLTWFSIPASQAAQFTDSCVSLPLSVPIAAGGGTVSGANLLLEGADGSRTRYTLADTPPLPADGIWSGQVTCVKTGSLFVEYTLTEDGQSQEFLVPLGGLVLIDPQGVVYDQKQYDAARAGGATEEQARATAAITGATVRLQRKVGDAFVNVLSGDPGITPNVNPQVTGADGRYQWDVAAGDYRVVVTKNGYVTETSRTVAIPPPVLDLHIGLDKVGSGETVPPVVPDPPRNDAPPQGAAGTPATPGTPARPATPVFGLPQPPKQAADTTCATKRGAAKRRCEADRRLAKELKACDKRKRSQRAACRRSANARARCERLAGKKRAACTKKLRKSASRGRSRRS